MAGERFRIFQRAASAEKLGAIGFKFRRFDERFWHHKVRSPDRPVVGTAEAAPGDQGFATRQPLSFDEELVESGMCAICTMRRKSQFQITRQLQLACFARCVHQSHAPDFGIVFRGDNNFRDRLARSTSSPKLCLVRGEIPGVTALG